jgi:hypothetical protein
VHQVIIEMDENKKNMKIDVTNTTPNHYVVGMLYEALLSSMEKLYEDNNAATMEIGVTMMEGLHKLLKDLVSEKTTLQ